MRTHIIGISVIVATMLAPAALGATDPVVDQTICDEVVREVFTTGVRPQYFVYALPSVDFPDACTGYFQHWEERGPNPGLQKDEDHCYYSVPQPC